MPEGGGGQVEVGTLNVLGHPRWGILANFKNIKAGPGIGKFEQCQNDESEQGIECGELE